MEPEIIELSSGSDDDGVVAVNNNNYTTVTVIGPPVPMPRPTFMAWMKGQRLLRRVVNKAAPKINAFRQNFTAILQQQHGINVFPIYEDGPVVMELQFYRRLPNTAFTNRQRWRGFAAGRYSLDLNWEDTQRPDIDNLAKFVLDALNGVVYKDDEQIVKLVTYKLIDNQDPRDGRTVVKFKALQRYVDLPQPPAIVAIQHL